MKTKLILILLLIHCIAEAQPLEMLVDTTKQWSTLWVSGWNPPPWPYFEYTSYTQFYGDVVIGSYHYRYVDDIEMSGYIREDSTNKVFFINPEYPSDTGRLLYDFGADAGDTLEIFPLGMAYPQTFVVSYVDSVLVCDQYKKRISLENDIWVEGIGSILWGVMMPGTIFTGVSNSFYCYMQNDTIKNPESDCVPCPDTCCYVDYVKVAETEPDNLEVTVAPNPVTSTSVLTIGSEAGNDFAIEIYNATGGKIRTAEVKDGKMIINRTGCSPGLYIYRLYNRKTPVISGKFIIK